MKRIPFAKLTPVLSVLFFVFALSILHGELARFHYRDISSYLDTLPRGRLLEALALTAVGYLALTGYDVLAFRYIRQSIPYPRVALASFVGYAFSNNLGMPLLTGTPVRIRFYTSWGISGLDVAKVIVFGHATFWLGFLSLSGAAFLTEPIAIPRSLGHGLISARPLGAVFLLLVAAYLAATLLGRGRTVTIKGLELGLPGPGLGLAQLAVASLDWTLAGSVFYSLLPPAWDITFLHFLGIFLFAQVAGLLSHVPGGLGVFETVMVLLLPPELPRPELLAAMVAYRAVYYFLPLLAAAVSLGVHEIAARREQMGRFARAVGQRAPDIVSPIFAVTTFLGGAILLASGATPAIHSRLSWLKDLLPLSVIEVSHFLGSLAGVALLFLAAGLQRRLDTAYHLTLLLLAGGAVLSLAKGLDYEEAIVLSVMFAALLPCHSHFDRKASLTAQTFTPGWIAAIAIVIAGSVWLGIFAYKHVDYSHDLWWRFTFGGNAPRFLRASVGVAALALVFGLAQLLKPAPPVRKRPTEEDLARAATIAAASPLTHSWLAILGTNSSSSMRKGVPS